MHDEKLDADSIRAAQVVLTCTELQPTLEFFTDRLGFRLDRISPADDPRSALLSGYGLQVVLRRGSSSAPGRLRLEYDARAQLAATEIVAPNGTLIEFAQASQPAVIPSGKQELVINHARDARRPPPHPPCLHTAACGLPQPCCVSARA